MFLILYISLTHYIIETHFNTFTNRADPDQAAIKAAWSGFTVFAYENIIRYDPTPASNFYVPCTNVKVYLCKYLLWVYLSQDIHEGHG